MENENNLIETELLVDSSIGMHLKETAGWGKFLGIAGFVYSVLIAVGGIFAATKLSQFSRNGSGVAAGGFVGVFYILIAVLVFFMSIFLFRFSQKTQTAIQLSDQASLTEAFRNLKIYFRVAGISMAVALIISALGIIGVMAASIFRG